MRSEHSDTPQGDVALAIGAVIWLSVMAVPAAVLTCAMLSVQVVSMMASSHRVLVVSVAIIITLLAVLAVT